MDIEAARIEIKRVDTVLRSRYNYAHPVFDYLAAALEALEGDLPEATPAGVPEETEEQLIAEAEAAVVVEEEVEEAAVEVEAEETITEPEPPTRGRPRRRG